jgi:hypothetical protein
MRIRTHLAGSGTEAGLKIWRVFLGDMLLLGPKLPVLLGGLVVCAIGFFFSLPPELARSGELPKISIALINHDDEAMAAVLAGMVSDLEMVENLYFVDEQEADALLRAGSADVSITLPAGMIDALIYRGQAEITLKALDPLVGSISLDIAAEYVKTMNRMQQTALAFYDQVNSLYDDRRTLYQAERAFNLSLLQEAISRSRHVSALPAVSPYYLQLLALLLFVAAAFTAVPLSALTARQFSAGYFRRLAVYRIRPAQICAAKILPALCGAVIFSLAALLLLAVWKIPCSKARLLLSACFLTLVIHFICMVFAAVRTAAEPRAAAARAALGSLVLFLFMLFAGGGFYPIYLPDAGFRVINPAWLAHLLAEWTLGGAALSPLQLLFFTAPAAVCAAVALAGWRQA